MENYLKLVFLGNKSWVGGFHTGCFLSSALRTPVMERKKKMAEGVELWFNHKKPH